MRSINFASILALAALARASARESTLEHLELRALTRGTRKKPRAGFRTHRVDRHGRAVDEDGARFDLYLGLKTRGRTGARNRALEQQYIRTHFVPANKIARRRVGFVFI